MGYDAQQVRVKIRDNSCRCRNSYVGLLLLCLIEWGAAQMVGGLAFMFNAPSGATVGWDKFNVSLGHVGWGFQDVPSNNFYFGATENRGGNFSVPAGTAEATQSWIQYGDSNTMYAAFKNAGFYHVANYYVYFRVKDVLVVDVNGAVSKAVEMAHNGFDASINNCLTKTVDILNAYGAGLGFRGNDFPPNIYFSNLPSDWSGVSTL